MHVYAATDAFTEELDKLADKRDLNDLIKRVNQPQSEQELRSGLDWLRAKSLSGFGGGRIMYSYSYLLAGAGIPDSASVIYILASLTSRIDAARCADPSAPSDKFQRWENSLTQIPRYYQSLPFEKREEIISLVVAWEEKISTRPPDAWLCNGGMSYMMKFMEKHKNDPNVPAREIEDKTRLGRTILLDDPEIQPEFVDDETWQNKRKTIIKTLSSQLLQAK